MGEPQQVAVPQCCFDFLWVIYIKKSHQLLPQEFHHKQYCNATKHGLHYHCNAVDTYGKKEAGTGEHSKHLIIK